MSPIQRTALSVSLVGLALLASAILFMWEADHTKNCLEHNTRDACALWASGEIRILGASPQPSH